jgi:hypothetical protein
MLKARRSGMLQAIWESMGPNHMVARRSRTLNPSPRMKPPRAWDQETISSQHAKPGATKNQPTKNQPGARTKNQPRSPGVGCVGAAANFWSSAQGRRPKSCPGPRPRPGSVPGLGRWDEIVAVSQVLRCFIKPRMKSACQA